MLTAMTLSGTMRADNHGQRTGRHAALVWFDPGLTCGAFTCTVRPDWLRGDGEPSWAGLARALSSVWFGQLGREARVFKDRAYPPAERLAVIYDRRQRNTSNQHRRRVSDAPVPPSLLTELEIFEQQVALLDLWPDAAWGYEAFVPVKPNTSREFLAPLRINARIEAAEMLYGESGRAPFVQSASYAKTTATDDRLRMAGLYRPGMPHATDAARHAVTFLRDARSRPDVRAMAWPQLFGAERAAREEIA